MDINDLPDSVLSKTRMFADQTVIYNTLENHMQLEKDPYAHQTWEATWNTEFNPLKCEYIKVSRKRTRGLETKYFVHYVTIPKNDGVKYLGVKLQNTLRWNNNNTNYISKKVSSHLGYIGRGISLLEYSSPVWDGSLTQTQSSRLEAVQRIAADTSLEPSPVEVITLRVARLVSE